MIDGIRIGWNVAPKFPREVAAQAARVSAAGTVVSVWTNQLPGSWDALSVLGGIGPGPAEVGTAVLPTYPRHPVVMATEVLTVQALTGGRLTLGVGPSHAWYISNQLGIPYTAPAQHTREYLEVLRPLLRGEHVRHDGKFYTVDTQLQIASNPEGELAVPPPVLLSALGPRMLEVARDLADGTITVWIRPETVASYLLPRLGAGARVVVLAMVAVTSEPDAVRETVAREFAVVESMPAYRAMLDRGGLAGPADAVIAGAEDDVLAELARFRDAGATDLIVSPVGPPEARARTLELVTAVNPTSVA
jgi:5,10-methylenetetrahydromethanopterin reductase